MIEQKENSDLIRKKVKAGYYDLVTVAPEVAAEWHPTLNGSISPSDVSYGSHDKACWLCPNGHAYYASIKNRVCNKAGCPYCAGKKTLIGFNDLVTVAPEVAKEWHPTLNGDLNPSDYGKSSKTKVWWLCPQGHAYYSQIANRVKNGAGCPYCSGKKGLSGHNDLLTVFPEIAADWHPTMNGELKPSNVTKCSSVSVWWLCQRGHAYQAKISQRVSENSGCPYCAGVKVLIGYNDLGTVCPELAAEWDQSKNGELTPSDVLFSSEKKHYWLCPKGHSYTASIKNRSINNTGCPYCSGQKALKGYNDLTTVAPEVAREWHPTKNGDLKPSDFIKGSTKKVFWLCPNGHEYKAEIGKRAGKRHSGCPYCSGKRLLKGFNDLETCYPEIAKEWHPTLNGDLKPCDITKGNDKKVSWLCPQGHIYEAKILHRTITGSGCPYCSGNRVLPEDSIAHKYPDMMTEWDAVSNYAICSPNEIGENSSYCVWWNCLNDSNHKYPMVVYQRVLFYRRNKNPCPYCKGRRRKKSHFV